MHKRQTASDHVLQSLTRVAQLHRFCPADGERFALDHRANTAGDLRFSMFSDETFDFLLAQSVFTHLKEEHIEQCFANIGRIMGTDSRFYFTFYSGEISEQSGPKSFRFPFSFFERVAKENGFELSERADDYPHPRGQRMAFVQKRSV